MRIYSPAGEVIGAGFLAAPGIVLTCHHVIGGAGEVDLDFPLLAPGRKWTAQVIRSDPERDVAVLRPEALPPDAEPLRLIAPEETWGHPFRTFGFPQGHPGGVWVEGKLRSPIGDTGWLQIEGVKGTGYFVQPGFSGAPVWDDALGGVVGMVTAVEGNPQVRAAFVIPAKVLRDIIPVDVDTGGDDEPLLNPFSDRGRINNPARFFDRRSILRELRLMLAQGNSVSLVGEVQIGKSSLLYVLFLTAKDWFPQGIVHYVDLQGVLDEADFCAEVLAGLGREPGDLRALKRALRRERLVLLLDEVEKLTRPAFTKDLHDLLRALAQEDTLTLAVASHRPLQEIFPPSGPTSPFHNIFTEKRLGPFSPADARAFLHHRLRGTGVVFTPEEVERLVMESGGHPARLQELAYRLFEEKRARR